jgi:hypothetical protein
METVTIRGFCSPILKPELSLISYVKPIEKYLPFEPRTGTKSHIYSQGKLTTLKSENRKIRLENEILKTYDHGPYV